MSRVTKRLESTMRILTLAKSEAKPGTDPRDLQTLIEAAQSELKEATAVLKRLTSLEVAFV